MKLSLANLNQMSLEFNPYFFTLFYESSAKRFLDTLTLKIKTINDLVKNKTDVLNIEEIEVKTLKELDAEGKNNDKENGDKVFNTDTDGKLEHEKKVIFDDKMES